MHDALNRPLTVGDRVLVPATITDISCTEDYCNVHIETTLGRRPDSKKENWSAVNTGVMLRANAADINNLDAAFEGTFPPEVTPHPAVAAVLQFFAFSHLPPVLQAVSKPFHDLAHRLAQGPQNAEATVALRKLLEAKDAAVRAFLFKPTTSGAV